MRFSMRFWGDFDAILRTKPAPAYPARVYIRVTLQQNTAKLAEILRDCRECLVIDGYHSGTLHPRIWCDVDVQVSLLLPDNRNQIAY